MWYTYNIVNNIKSMGIRGKLTNEEKAYVAGLFDGEGHVIIYRWGIRQSDKYKTKSPAYTLICGLTNTDKKMIDFVYDRWGASRSIRERVWGHPTWKTCYSWTIQANMAMNFLKDVLPWLITKKEKAKIGIEFQEKIGTFGKKELPKEEVKRREECWKKLNKHHKTNKIQVFKK